ncbi:MAG: MFS transporter [Clostridia bacterium]|nr:MFS transporter [Clostridia bacterium]
MNVTKAQGQTINTKQAGFLMFMCWLAYTTAYLGRLNYSASLIQIVEELGTTKAQAGLVASVFFFSYGAGQIIHGTLNKYYNPRWAIMIALVLSALWNVLMSVSSLPMMIVFWLLNGLTQSVLWTTLTRVQSMYLGDGSLRKAVVIMGSCVASGTCLTYAFSALFAEFLNWKFSFYLAGVLLSVVGIFWFIAYGKVTNNVVPRVLKMPARKTKEEKQSSLTPGLILFFAAIFLFAIIHHLIRDGLTTWTPTIFYELYGLPESYSILFTLGLPLLSLLSSALCVKVNRWIKDQVYLGCFFFGIAMIFVLITVLCLPTNMWWITLICFAISSLSMAAINNIITSLIPLQMRDRVDSARSAGFCNAFCYLGSTIATYSLGAMADNLGWNSIFWLFLGLIVVSLMIGAVYFALKKKFPIDK